MTVTSIRYQPIEGGALGGHFALHVTLGAASAPGVFLSPTDLATRIHEIFENLDLKSKAVRGVLLDCRDAVILSEDMTSLLGILKDWGIHIVLWVDEGTRYSWFELASYITVFVRSKHWSNFRVNEIRYILPPEDLNEPDVFEVNQNAPGYIVVGLNATAASILNFVTEAKRAWGIVSYARIAAAIDFPVKASK